MAGIRITGVTDDCQLWGKATLGSEVARCFMLGTFAAEWAEFLAALEKMIGVAVVANINMYACGAP